jgi:hypothetical protein
MEILSLRKKWLEHDADNSPALSVEVYNVWGFTYTSPVSHHSMVLRLEGNYIFIRLRQPEEDQQLKAGLSFCPFD